MIFSLDSFLRILRFLPLIESVLNRRFWYVICVNTLVWSIGFWLLTGGGQYETDSISYYTIKNILANFMLWYCVFYVIQFIPFSVILEYFLVTCFFLIGLCDIFLSLAFNAQLNTIFFTIVLSSNLLEAKEFLQFYASSKVIFALSGFILASFIFLYPQYTLRFIQYKPKPYIHRIYGALLFLVCLFLFTSKLYSVDSQNAWLEEKNALFRYANIIIESITEHTSYITQYKNLTQTLDQNLTLRQEDEILDNTLHLPTIVLIIGESTQRNYMSLYNYALPTTPQLDALLQSGNLIVFSDVVSPHSHTNESLQKILTFSNYENAQTPWFMQQNLIDILNLAGYKTHWLSNQEAISIYGNVPEVLSQRAKYTHFSSINDSYNAGKAADGILIPLLEQTLMSFNQKEKNFYTIHLMGTHLDYKHRYPKAFSHFSPQDLKTHQLDTFFHSQEKLNNSQLETKSHYLNAILYNDYVVRSIIESFADKEALVIYLSDHGDEVYDFRDFVGHTETMGSRFMIEVPFMVYMSESFKKKYPDIFAKVHQAKDKPFMSDDFIHSFLDLLGIVSKDSISSRSIFSPSYNQNRARIFSGRDYDKDLKFEHYKPFVPSRLWLHRVDEVEKFEDFKEKYRGFEIDVHFLLNPSPHFDVGHDGVDSSIGLNLADMFSLVQKQNMEHLMGGGDIIKLWIDFKNLSEENKHLALTQMQHLCLTYDISPSNLIIESHNYKSLDVFKQQGFFTSYYVPYYEPKHLKSQAQTIRDEINTIIQSGNVSALSFPFYLYDFIIDSHFQYYQDNEWIDMPLLTWNEGANWKENIQTKAFFNPQIKAILVGEKGSYR